MCKCENSMKTVPKISHYKYLGARETCSLYFSKFVTDPKKTSSFLVNMDLHVCKVIREWLNTALTQLDATSVLLCFTRAHKTCCEKNLPVYHISLMVFIN